MIRLLIVVALACVVGLGGIEGRVLVSLAGVIAGTLIYSYLDSRHQREQDRRHTGRPPHP